MKRRLPVLFAMFAIAAASSVVTRTAAATILCVETAADLFEDLAAYSDGGANSGDDLAIHLVVGVYKVGPATGNNPFTYFKYASTGYLSISGGFTVGCAEQIPGLNLTILDGAGIAEVLSIDNVNATYIDQIVVENGETVDDGGGISVNGGVPGGSVYITNSIIQDNHTTGYSGGLEVYSSGASSDVYVTNNLILNNSSDSGYGAARIIGDTIDALVVVSNTVYGNTTAMGTIGGFTAGATVTNAYQIFIASNIFAQNTKTDLYMTGTPGLMYYNDYGTLGGVAPATKIGNVSVSPKFVNAAGGDFHLSSASPLIGLSIGRDCWPPSDLDGYARNYYSSTCDPGAYAETIFSSSFENQ